jgi:hypothetical protein
MLTVVTVALVGVIPALVNAEVEVAIGVDIPYFAVCSFIGGLKCSPNVVVAYCCMPFYYIV